MGDEGDIGDEPYFDYIVYGRPPSTQLQSRGSNPRPKKEAGLPAWRATIADAIREARDTYSGGYFLEDDVVRLDLFWVYDEKNANDPDPDNMVKPFKDELEGVLFDDDRVVKEMHLFKFSLREPKQLDMRAEKLDDAFASNREFVYVRVTRIKRDAIRVVGFVK